MKNFVLTAYRVGLFYIVLLITKVAFYIYHHQVLGSITLSELPDLLLGSLVFDTASMGYALSVFLVFALLPFPFRNNKVYQKVLLILYMVIVSTVILLNLTDILFFTQPQQRITAHDIYFLVNNDNNLVLMLRFIGENLLLLFLLIGLIVGLYFAYTKVKLRIRVEKSSVKFYLINTTLLVLTIILVIGGIRGGFTRMTRPITLSNAGEYVNSSYKAHLILSNPFCIIRTIGSKVLPQYHFFSDSTAAKVYTPTHLPSTTHSFTRKNIVILIVESFSKDHSKLLCPELYKDKSSTTPFLDSLMQQHYYFTHAFAVAGKSIDAIPAVLASIPSYETPFVLMPEAVGDYDALPQILRRNHYHTSFFCGSAKGSMGFWAFAKQLGTEHYFAKEDYEKLKGSNDFDGFWGIWDIPFLDYMAGQLTTFPEPFFSMAFTTTSHHPFNVPEHYRYLPKGETKAHQPVRYTDKALQHFFHSAQQKPWYKNTIFVVVADHPSSERFDPKSYTPVGQGAIIMSIVTGDETLKGVNHHTVQQTDIMPTLLGLLHYKEPYFGFGRDIFNEPNRLPVSIGYTGEGYKMITDSLLMVNNFKKSPQMYQYYQDAELQYNIFDSNNPQHLSLDSLLKVNVQQYYTTLKSKTFKTVTLPASSCK